MKKDDATYIETPVEISGSDDQINKAKELIQEIIGPSSSVINNMGGTLYKYMTLGFYMYLTSWLWARDFYEVIVVDLPFGFINHHLIEIESDRSH